MEKRIETFCEFSFFRHIICANQEHMKSKMFYVKLFQIKDTHIIYSLFCIFQKLTKPR